MGARAWEQEHESKSMGARAWERDSYNSLLPSSPFNYTQSFPRIARLPIRSKLSYSKSIFLFKPTFSKPIFLSEVNLSYSKSTFLSAVYLLIRLYLYLCLYYFEAITEWNKLFLLLLLLLLSLLLLLFLLFRFHYSTLITSL